MILASLREPDRDRRLEQIGEARAHSFQWVFDDANIGFSKWLRTGADIFWISGKPGSGKSTLMKHIYNNRQTADLITQWGSQSRQITATFFFHHRGNAMQKSFEGLLRGIISQVLEREPELVAVMRQMLIQEYIDRVNGAELGDLKSDLMETFRVHNLVYNDEAARRTEAIMKTWDLRGRLVQTFSGDIEALSDEQQTRFERTMLLRKSELSQARRKSAKAFQEAVEDLFSTPNFPLKYKSSIVQLTQLTQSWLEAIDHGIHISALLRKCGFPRTSTTMDQVVSHIISKQDKRNAILKSIMQKTWRRKELEAALFKLLAQNEVDLQLTLFLDALDEYDGNPDFIAAFLSSLTNKAHRRTQVRICFSSRPWDAFVQEFSGFPGFKIHEHTEGDIRAYCMDIISSHRPDAIEPLAGLLPEIVRRAQGVFLWVRLVLDDLTRTVRDVERVVDLQKVLESLPDELDDYYVTIVNRIPKSSHWDAYVLLECVSRARWDLDTRTAARALALSLASGYTDAKRICDRRKVQAIERDLKGDRRSEWDHFLRKVAELSGGLVETVRSGQQTNLQLMHQTIMEFVQHPTFKHKILGDWAKMTHENGNSFLSKAYLFDGSAASDDMTGLIWTIRGYYAREAELTTGKSQFALFSQAAPDKFRSSCPITLPPKSEVTLEWEPSALSFALVYGLNLYLDDALTGNPLLSSKAQRSLFSPLLIALHTVPPPEQQILQTAWLIIRHGCRPTMKDLKFLFSCNGNTRLPCLPIVTLMTHAMVRVIIL